MNRTSLIALGLLATSLVAGEPAADKLIDGVIKAPGDFWQMCGDPSSLNPKVNLPFYRFIAYRTLHVGPANTTLLRTHRAEVAPALTRRLASIDLSQPARAAKEMVFRPLFRDMVPSGDAVEDSGMDPHSLNGVVLEIIILLDAVETLPELLRLEDHLHQLLTAAEADPKLAVPAVLRDGCIVYPTGKKSLSKRDRELTAGRVVQRELLSVMLQLMRRQRFEPLVASSIEKTYGKLLKKRAKEEDLADIKTPEDAKKPGNEWVRFDPIHHVPIGGLSEETAMPFSSKLRAEIRELAKKFTATVPREKWVVTNEPLSQ
jgi:hypothetical protein